MTISQWLNTGGDHYFSQGTAMLLKSVANHSKSWSIRMSQFHMPHRAALAFVALASLFLGAANAAPNMGAIDLIDQKPTVQRADAVSADRFGSTSTKSEADSAVIITVAGSVRVVSPTVRTHSVTGPRGGTARGGSACGSNGCVAGGTTPNGKANVVCGKAGSKAGCVAVGTGPGGRKGAVIIRK
ncbi:MAG: hypothetical protein AAGF59_05640 [Pseudomonadota bacterium]